MVAKIKPIRDNAIQKGERVQIPFGTRFDAQQHAAFHHEVHPIVGHFLDELRASRKRQGDMCAYTAVRCAHP